MGNLGEFTPKPGKNQITGENKMAQNNKLPANVIKRIISNGASKTSIIYKYYDTEIVTINCYGFITDVFINTGGFFTKSTARHIKNLLALHGIKVNISFAQNDRFISYKGNKYDLSQNTNHFSV